uniref:Uncharacterized protein n=1 Tax=Fagus sylvatica TaxID=28930 RepID=A0A2N9FRZ3_FAGSY
MGITKPPTSAICYLDSRRTRFCPMSLNLLRPPSFAAIGSPTEIDSRDENTSQLGSGQSGEAFHRLGSGSVEAWTHGSPPSTDLRGSNPDLRGPVGLMMKTSCEILALPNPLHFLRSFPPTHRVPQRKLSGLILK